jgi:hypothetical protein
LSGVERRNTEIKSPEWETELWSYISQGDGINCPVYESCIYRLKGNWCLNEHKEYFDAVNSFIDEDNPDPDIFKNVSMKSICGPKNGRVFELVQQLAYKYHQQAGLDDAPVPSDLITRGEDNLPIEVRRIPMKSYHGAVWQLSDCWLIQLNSEDSPARQRFTIYHEIFHILAHNKGTPVFKKTPNCQEGSFNELLADHFAAIILMPRNLVMQKWQDIKDVDRMANEFEVPRSLVLMAAHNWHLT